MVALVRVADATDARTQTKLAHALAIVRHRDGEFVFRIPCHIYEELARSRFSRVVREVAECGERLVVRLRVRVEEGGARAERRHVAEVVVHI